MRPRKFRNFEFTGEYQKVCFNGWDGKSYNGESEVLPVYQLSEPFRSRMITMGKSSFVPKYTRKWGWTMHEVLFEYPMEDGTPTTDFWSEVEEIKD